MISQPYKRSFATSSFTPIGNHAGTTDAEKRRIKTFIIAAVAVVIILILIVIGVVKATMKNSFLGEEQGIPQETDQGLPY